MITSCLLMFFVCKLTLNKTSYVLCLLSYARGEYFIIHIVHLTMIYYVSENWPNIISISRCQFGSSSSRYLFDFCVCVRHSQSVITVACVISLSSLHNKVHMNMIYTHAEYDKPPNPLLELGPTLQFIIHLDNLPN